VKQVYATGPLATPGRPTRPAVRASSAGTTADAVNSALDFANYLAPTPAPRGDEPTPKLPVRLSLIGTPATGRVLTHVAPNGGTYFAHSLLDVPAGTDAHTAIQTWGSPHWQRHEPDAPADLPDLPFLPVADVLDDGAVKAWLTDPAHREMLEYAFAALLVAPADGRVVLAAPADDVATVVYAVTRAFPSNLTDDFTFSTYETDPLACQARLVGRDPGPDGQDLPEGCYRDGNYGYNPSTGRKSLLPREVGFAAFAANALATGDTTALDDLRGTWQRLGLSDPHQFDLVDRIARGTGQWAKYEIAAAVTTPAVAAWLAGRPDVVRPLTEWALDDRAFATGPYAHVVRAMRQTPDALAKLAQAVRGAGLAAVSAGQTTQAGNAFDVLLPLVAPAKAAGIWGDVLAEVKDPSALSWPTRCYLLPRLARYTPAGGGAAALKPWLACEPSQLPDLLALDLPRPLTVAAARAAWANAAEDVADDAVATALAAHPAVALAALKPTGDDAESSAKLFAALLRVAPARPWFEDVLAASADYPKPLLNQFFESDLAAGRADADRVVRTHGPKLLDLFSGQSGLDALGTRFLATPPADLLHQPALIEFLKSIVGREGMSEALNARAGGVLTIASFLESPSFTPDAMAPVAAALDLAPSPLPPSAKAETFRAVARALSDRADSPDLSRDLEAAVSHLGDALAKGPSDLFQDLLRELRQSPDFARHPNLVASVLATALGAVADPALAGRLNGLEPDAFAVATDAAKAGKKKLLAEIDRRAAAWPKDARAKWGFLLEAVRPRIRFGRDAFCFTLGIAVTAVAGVILKMAAILG
jgi:hypothetical protein